MSEEQVANNSSTKIPKGLNENTDVFDYVEDDLQPILEMTAEQRSNFEAIQKAKNEKFKMDIILGTYKDEEKNNLNLKKLYGRAILIALAIELIIGNIVFLFIGKGILVFDEWVVNVFFIGMYTQIIALATIVIKSLFPNRVNDSLQNFKDVFK